MTHGRSMFALAMLVGAPMLLADAPADLDRLIRVGDLQARAARFAPLRFEYDLAKLPAEDAALIRQLLIASQLADEIYWRQNTSDGVRWLEIARQGRGRQRADLLRYLRISGGRFDPLDENRAFVGDEGRRPPGGGYYPEDMTKAEIDGYLAGHPSERTALESANSIVRRGRAGLVVVPYHEAYPDLVGKLASSLEEAAKLSRHAPLARYLARRAEDLRTDDYFESDSLWIDLTGTPYDFLVGPYETYGDELLGVKAAYTAVLMKIDEAQTARLSGYQKLIPELEQALPTAPELKARKAGASNPMTVVDSIYRAGDAAPGYQFVAFNLPNDARVNEAKGSRKVLHRNFLDARMKTTIRPIADRLLSPEAAALVGSEALFDFVLFHEIAHGLGAQTVVGTERAVNAALGQPYSAIEEAKADVCGLLATEHFVERGTLPASGSPARYLTFVGASLRSIRFAEEAHAVAARVHLNRMLEAGALRWVASSKRFEVDAGRLPALARKEALELLTVEATGDAARAREIVEREGRLTPALAQAMEAAADIPIDFEPVYVVR